jgi:hypothetical protein
MKIHILKVTDRVDYTSDPMYYTMKSLRDNVINVWYDTWGEHREEPQAFTKEQIKETDDNLFNYLSSWNFNVEIILTLTENDLK